MKKQINIRDRKKKLSNCSNILENFVNPKADIVEKLNSYVCHTESNKMRLRKHVEAFDTEEIESAESIFNTNTLPNVTHSSTKATTLINHSSLKSSAFGEEFIFYEGKPYNVNFENELKMKKREKDIQISYKKNIIKELVNEINTLQVTIEESEAQVEHINKLLDTSKPILDKKVSYEKKDPLKALVGTLFKKTAMKQVGKKDDNLQKIEKKKNFKLEKKQQLSKLEDELKILKFDQKIITDKLLNHYHQVLKHGKDTRSEGLVWIIKEIMLLNTNVKLSYLPTFLDEDSIIYLFKIANSELQLFKISEEKQNLKLNLQKQKQDFFKNTINENKKKVFRTSLDNNDNSNINSQYNLDFLSNKKSKKKMELGQDMDFNVKEVTSYLDRKVYIDANSKFIIDQINDIEKREKELSDQLNSLKTEEMNRIFKQFNKNDYARRFNIDKASVISALIGEENTPAEIAKQTRQQRLYLEELKKCRSFNPLAYNLVSLKPIKNYSGIFK